MKPKKHYTTPYDIVPYESNPYEKTHPENLFTIGRIFGLTPPDYKNARVLEIGCASGGNLIPMACNLPDSEFTGIDFSAGQIETANNFVCDLEIKNISLKHLSITDIDHHFPEFDYIIAHGIYSWVSKDVQEKILAVCRDHMAPNGIALISYNTLPGWNMVKSIRELMLYHVKGFNDPEERANQARSILKFIIEGLGDADTPYAAFLKSEMELLAMQHNSYLLHDHLEETNDPIYFNEFIKSAQANDLDYLADTDMSTMYLPNMPEIVSAHLKEITDIVRAEQYMDFIRNRRFRSTMLCHKDLEIKRQLCVDDINKFYVSSCLKPDKPVEQDDLERGASLRFSSDYMNILVKDKFSKLAMLILSEQKGKPAAYNDIIDETISRSGLKRREIPIKKLNEKLDFLRLSFAGIINIHSSGGDYITTVTDSPRTTKLICYQARQGVSVANQRHQQVKVNIFEKVLVQYLDGHNCMDIIVENMCSHVERGEIRLFTGEQEILDSQLILKQVRSLTAATLDKFAENAMLTG